MTPQQVTWITKVAFVWLSNKLTWHQQRPTPLKHHHPLTHYNYWWHVKQIQYIIIYTFFSVIEWFCKLSDFAEREKYISKTKFKKCMMIFFLICRCLYQQRVRYCFSNFHEFINIIYIQSDLGASEIVGYLCLSTYNWSLSQTIINCFILFLNMSKAKL